MIKFGLVGCGAWGTKVADAIRALGFECDAISGRSGIESFEYNALVDCSDIVFIATHPVCCVEMARHALSNGKLTIVEKPVGFDAHEVKDLLDLSRANKVPFIVDYVHLFNQSVLDLNIDGLRLLEIDLGNKGPDRDYSALWDYGSHAVAVALGFFERPPVGLRIFEKSGGFEVHLDFGRKRAILNVSNAYHSRTAKFTVSTERDERAYDDVGSQQPLQHVISTAARLHLRGEYFTNGALAVEVTDVLERLHAMLPK